MGKVVRAFHCGRALRSPGFELKHIGAGEGYGILGPGIYFSSSREIAMGYCKYAKRDARLYEVEFSMDGFVDVGESSHQWDDLLRIATQEFGADLLNRSHSEMKYGRGVIGAIHKRAGAKRLWEILAYAGVTGVIERLPNGEIEYAVFDPSIIKIIGSENMTRDRKSNPPPASDIWKTHRQEYIESKFPGASISTIYREHYDQMRQYEREWEHEMKLALTYGLITPKEAEVKRFTTSEADKVRPLPAVLYHVTSAKNEILDHGLRTKDQLKMGRGRGLGGGTSDTISLTTSMDIAQSIYQGLLEGRMVAKGELSIPVMIEASRRGIGAKRPWLKNFFGYYNKTNPRNWDNEIPKEIFDVMSGVSTDRDILPKTLVEKEKESVRKELVHPWEPVERWDNGDEGLYISWSRKLPEEELIDKWFDIYKAWIMFREEAGGISNPLFFLSDTTYLSRIEPSQVAILEFKSKPGTYGYYLPGEKEYRIWDGDAVELTGIVAEGE